MKTKHTTSVLMSPDQLPQQRIAAVVTIPEKPIDLVIRQWHEQPRLPDPPQRSPRNVTLICSAEWAWSPMHSRIDNYYLGRRKSRWLLWNNWVNDNEIPWAWNWDYLSYTENADRADIEAIAAHLLLSYWRAQVANGELYDQPHWINHDGILEIPMIHAITREIWDE
jgi:hypothetical protein